MRQNVLLALKALFDHYNSILPKKSNVSHAQKNKVLSVPSNDMNIDIMTTMYMKHTGNENMEEKSELDKYLDEVCEPYCSVFDVLEW